ncbi:unnamed protein product [Alopecurus aequalis]
MSSLALGRGLEHLELWLFTAAELAAADLLLQLSVGGAGGDDEAAESSSSATTYSSWSPCLEDLAAEEEERAVEERAFPPVGSVDLDRRARKRCRLPRRSASPCLGDLTARAEEEGERAVEETPLPLGLGSVDLDRRARKRYRLLSELYGATAPVTSADSEKKRKAHHRSDVFGSSSEATRYGGD